MHWLRLTTLVLVLSVFTHAIFGQVVQPSSNQNTKNSAITTKKTATQPSTDILTISDKFLALINYIRNYPGRVSRLLRKHTMNNLCKYFKSRSCILLSFDLTHIRQVPKLWPSADLNKLTKELVKKLVKSQNLSKKEVQGFIDKTKKDLNFEKFDGDCFSYKELRLNNIQRVFSMILNKPEYRYSQSSDIITTTFKKLSQLILPRKYESIHKQKIFGRKLKAAVAEKTSKGSDNDRLTAGFNIVNHRSNFYGCLFIGKLKMTGASKVKSPYNKAKTEALNQYMKENRSKFDKAFISKKQAAAQLMKDEVKKRVAMFKNLQAEAKIESEKRPKD